MSNPADVKRSPIREAISAVDPYLVPKAINILANLMPTSRLLFPILVVGCVAHSDGCRVQSIGCILDGDAFA